MMDELAQLLQDIRSCRVCEQELALGANPILSVSEKAKILLVGQAPGTRVHKTGIPWNDPSGERLRDWMGVSSGMFYDSTRIAIIPMGFCYPGKGTSGDLPPRPECAPLWRQKLHDLLPNIELTLLIGQYAQHYYLKKARKKTLTDTVRAWSDYAPDYLPLPHPSPRNTYWLSKHPWFEAEVLPVLKERISYYLI